MALCPVLIHTLTIEIIMSKIHTIKNTQKSKTQIYAEAFGECLAAYEIDLFKQGDIGYIIAPPATQEYIYMLAKSVCTTHPGGLDLFGTPRMENVAYIDTLLTKEKKNMYKKFADLYYLKAASKEFHVFSKDKLYKTWQGKISENKGEFDYLTNQLSRELANFNCIFINLASLLFSPNSFDQDNFDNLIAWTLEMKRLGKTIVLFSHYQLPHTEYLTKQMDFVINLIPNQRSENPRGCTFGVQWLKQEGSPFDPINSEIKFHILLSIHPEIRAWIRFWDIESYTTSDADHVYHSHVNNELTCWPGLQLGTFDEIY